MRSAQQSKTQGEAPKPLDPPDSIVLHGVNTCEISTPPWETQHTKGPRAHLASWSSQCARGYESASKQSESVTTHFPVALYLRLRRLRWSPGPLGLPGRAMASCGCASAVSLPASLPAVSWPMVLSAIGGCPRKGDGGGVTSWYRAAVLLQTFAEESWSAAWGLHLRDISRDVRGCQALCMPQLTSCQLFADLQGLSTPTWQGSDAVEW